MTELLLIIILGLALIASICGNVYALKLAFKEKNESAIIEKAQTSFDAVAALEAYRQVNTSFDEEPKKELKSEPIEEVERPVFRNL